MIAHMIKHPFDFKTQYGLGFNPQDDEIVVDFFCGGGGTGTGLDITTQMLVRPPDNGFAVIHQAFDDFQRAA